MSPFSLPVGRFALLACLWEVTARKPGNVHRYRDFDDLTYLDFVASAAEVASVLETASYSEDGLGKLILCAVSVTRLVVSTNANLGIILVLAPLASVPSPTKLREGIAAVLDRLTIEDSRDVYEAIRLAKPGGLGRVEDQDVSIEPTLPLREVMALAADRDLVARQYANGFRE